MIDAVSIAAAVRTGETSATAETIRALERAEAATDLNAFTRLDPDRALSRARLVDDAVAAGQDPGPLGGVPIALKDIVDQAGIPTTAGSSFLRSPADRNAPVVDRLEAAGAVIVGRTGLHEFAYGFSSENEWWGPVLNPWDPTTSPGGSSGGSAAAVAAGVVPVGIGTDTGGSVRVPAALCGSVGLKVTHGRVPLRGVFPLAPSLDTVGPITSSVRDATTVYRVVAGYDPDDRWSRDQPIGSAALADGIGSLTIGIPHPWVDRTIAAGQASGFALIRRAFEDAGARVIDLDAPDVDHRDLSRFPASYHEVAAVHRAWFEEGSERYGPSIRDRIETVLGLTQADVDAAHDWRSRLVAAFGGAFAACDLLLTPTTAARAKPIGHDLLDVGAGPEPYRTVLSWFTPLVNQAGLPAIALPVEDPSVPGLPPSIQLIGPDWSESTLLATATALDAMGVVAARRPSRVTR